MLKTFPLNSVKPTGWMKRQLEIQAKGLSGHLDKIWPDVSDSAWIGGSHEGWERVPYWLDGFVPLAYLLEDDDLISRANKYISGILAGQKPDGWICPCDDDKREKYDIWSAFLIGKVLSLYCQFTDDQKAYKGLYDSMKCLHALLKEKKIALFDWGKFRWFECIIPLLYMWEKQPEDWIIDLAKELKAQGADYSTFTETWKRPLNKWTFHTHIVNIAMMFKYEAVYCRLTGEKATDTAEELWSILEKYNGTAVGTFTGDECLSGIGSNHGTELCSVVELMYSCEVLYAITGKSIWAKRLEKIAFNALPATLSDDMWTHQYNQLVNQIACLRIEGKQYFRTNTNEANVFGLEPHFGCCTANFSQGWPKLAMNAFLKSSKGVVCPVILPAELNTKIKGADVKIESITEYPFRFSCKYTVSVSKPVKFSLKIRLPHWAKTVTLNGEKTAKREYLVIEKLFEGSESFELEFTDTPRFVTRPGNMKVAEYGPFVFSVPLESEFIMHEYEKKGVERKFPYCDYEIMPKSEWRLGFAGKELVPAEAKGDDIPFSSKNPRLTLSTEFYPVEWDYADGYENIAENYPVSRKATGAKQALVMIPYGCAKLRMTEMPLAQKSSKEK